jgi:exodeoxyribonuclease-3
MTGARLTVATYNVNGLRARIDALSEWLRRQAPDILCLQETKVEDRDFPFEPFHQIGYHVAYRGQKAHAGVAIVSRMAPADVAYGLDDDGPPDEPRLIRAVISGITIVNTYVPQGREVESEHFRYKLEWLARLRSFFQKHYTPQASLLWAGDLNVAPEPIDVHDPKRLEKHVDFHPEARAALERVREWGFVDVFRKHHRDEPGQYTYWDYRVRGSLDRGLGWRIDHIWTSETLADRCTASWIDVEPRRAERPSDHTYLLAGFSL